MEGSGSPPYNPLFSLQRPLPDPCRTLPDLTVAPRKKNLTAPKKYSRGAISENSVICHGAKIIL